MNRPGRVVAAALLLGACDFPTEPPRWEQTWVVPAAAVSIHAADLLPPDVSLTQDGSAFAATTSPMALATTLGELCPECAAADGAFVPKPAFEATLTGASDLPDDVVSATLESAALVVSLEHGFTFDPLRPGGAGDPRGYLVVTVTHGPVVLARDSLSGDDHAFPAHVPLETTLQIPGTTLSESLTLQVHIVSPAGEPVLIRSDDALSVDMPGAEVRITEAVVRATDLSVSPARTSMEFDLDEFLPDRVRRGALRFQIGNPWDVSGRLDVRLEFGADALDRSLAVQPGQYSQRLELSGLELRDLLAAGTVEIITTGQVSGSGGTVTLRPAQELTLDATFELVILVGGREDEP